MSIASIIILAIHIFARIIIYALVAEAILSWFVAVNPYSQVTQIYQLLCRFTEPVVAPCRYLLSRWNTGMFDWSVLLALILVKIVERVLAQIIWFVLG